MLKNSKKCENCLHTRVCEKKGLRKMFESELSFFIESFDEEVMNEFDLSNQCKDYLERKPMTRTSFEPVTASAMTARNI